MCFLRSAGLSASQRGPCCLALVFLLLGLSILVEPSHAQEGPTQAPDGFLATDRFVLE